MDKQSHAYPHYPQHHFTCNHKLHNLEFIKLDYPPYREEVSERRDRHNAAQLPALRGPELWAAVVQPAETVV